MHLNAHKFVMACPLIFTAGYDSWFLDIPQYMQLKTANLSQFTHGRGKYHLLCHTIYLSAFLSQIHDSFWRIFWITSTELMETKQFSTILYFHTFVSLSLQMMDIF